MKAMKRRSGKVTILSLGLITLLLKSKSRRRCMAKRQPLPMPNINSLSNKLNLKATSFLSTKRRTFKLKIASRNNSSYTNLSDLIVTPSPSNFQKQRMK